MSEMDKLKACPFCGSIAMVWESEPNRFYVECSHSCVIIPSNQDEWFTSEQNAINRWNTRASGDE